VLASRKKLILAALSAISLLSMWAGRYYSGGSHARAHHVEDVLPAFIDPPAGPRAPARHGFGVPVGKTSLGEIEAFIAKHQLACRDTSARALIREAREKKQRVEDVDANTSASGKKTSPMEKNPQVRLSCEGTAASKIGDRARTEGTGRLLFVFDSPKHDLRHVSFRRVFTDHASARKDLVETIDAVKAVYGEPTAISGTLPAEGTEFAKLEPYKLEWVWTDLKISVSGLSYGERGVDVYEAFEVPWPVRVDHSTIQ
jgi:hypothetical protein